MHANYGRRGLDLIILLSEPVSELFVLVCLLFVLFSFSKKSC